MAADRHAGAAPAAVPGWARGITRLAVLTGAGISTDSGIPDFRGPSRIWTKDPTAEKLSTYQAYMADPELRRRSWQIRLSHPAWAAEPNPAHLALARLARSPIDTAVITQNIDGLHQRAGTPPGRVIELHGTMFAVVCTGCGDRTAMADALARVRAGEGDPPCTSCGGILKSATVMFGQVLEPAAFERAAAAAAGCDLMLAIGSTLIVEPAASLCAIAAEAGAALVIVNRDPTPHDATAAAVIRDPIGAAVPQRPPSSWPPAARGRPPPRRRSLAVPVWLAGASRRGPSHRWLPMCQIRLDGFLPAYGPRSADDRSRASYQCLETRMKDRAEADGDVCGRS